MSRNTRAALVAILAAAPLAHADCRPDLTGDGRLDFFDFLEFQNLFAAGDLRADFDDSGSLDFFDFLAFQNAFAAGCPRPGVDIASSPLPGYPHADFAESYHQGRPIHASVDPVAHPDVVGRDVDLYIVAARSAAEWATDPELTDARGAAQPANFPGGASVALNRIALSGLTLIGPATADRFVASGYDLVIDVDRDGALSEPDLIDGAGDDVGFWIVRDLTQPGAFPVSTAVDYAVSFPGIPSTRNRQKLVFPDDPALTAMPLIVIAHGNGHDYRWYDYALNHFASHGYVAMSHQNDTVPGIEAASETILRHTDAFLGDLATIAGGALDGRIDTSRIMWIGHSRGGEGVVRAIDKIVDETYTPLHYTLDDLDITSSIAPTVWLGFTSQPHDENYHLLFGAADGDVCGCPHRDDRQSFQLLERATSRRQSSYVHGADHNDFNCCGFDDFTGPAGTAIGRSEAQKVAKGVWLALAERYLRDNLATDEHIWRQYETFAPPAVVQTVTVVNEHTPEPARRIVIDDYQSAPALAEASSGAAVAFDVASAIEGVLDDSNTDFTWLPTDPMNGMTRAGPSDSTAGVVFEWDGAAYYEFQLLPGQQDLSGFAFLSLRACQMTRHPLTDAEKRDLTFSIALRDTTGRARSINIGVYGGGVEEPYQRTGYGTGAGWQNEMETIRVALGDFLRDGSQLDLSAIEAIRLEFGPDSGAAQGRIGLDDVELILP
ncbi:MAG: GC-type dockerin domain-anchored protein [Phycisphaerales bacterium JB039]